MFLESRKDHPTADVVYENVKKTYPNISLGTVYRNLSLLADMGEVIKISTKEGSDRFDATTEPHYHFTCDSCGCVQDIIMPPIARIEKEASEYTNFTIHSHEIQFFGKCSNCQNKEK